MPRRSYSQACGLAVALDLLGERWTLLILRELMPGPRRFTDLLDNLPGMSTGLLSERLRTLEAGGVVERGRLPPPAASAVYSLAPAGEELRPLILGLARWGIGRLREPDAFATPQSVMVGLEASFVPEASAGADGVYEMRVDDIPYGVAIENGRVTVRAGAPHAPVATLSTDPRTLVALSTGTLALEDALAGGALAVAADTPDAGERVLRLAAAFGLTTSRRAA